MANQIHTYGYGHNTYPIFSDDTAYEGAFKRFSAFPLPIDVYNYALMGIPKIFPLTKEPIPVQIAEDALNSAVTEFEMTSGFDLSPVTRYQPEDYIDGLFTNNWTGTRLSNFPATKVIRCSFKFPHATSQNPYKVYTIPPEWVYLRGNNMNVMASAGSVGVSTENSAVTANAGILAYVAGFTRGSYTPGGLEIVYQSGWDSDRLPNSVRDLVITWASARMLTDLIPIMAPFSQTSTSIDGVSQGASINLAQLLFQRIQGLEKKKEELYNSMLSNFGQTINISSIGS